MSRPSCKVNFGLADTSGQGVERVEHRCVQHAEHVHADVSVCMEGTTADRGDLNDDMGRLPWNLNRQTRKHDVVVLKIGSSSSRSASRQ